MKKVLIISYYWPPAGGPGSQRAVKFSKYLPAFGWQPLIFTVKKGEFPYYDPSLEKDVDPGLKIFRTFALEPFRLFKKLSGIDSNTPIPVGHLTRSSPSVQHKIFNWIRANIFIPDARVGWVLTARCKIDQIIKKEKIDLVFTTSPPHSLQFIGRHLKKKYHLPWVADFRDPWTTIQYYQVHKRSKISHNIDSRLEKSVVHFCDHLTSVSQTVVKSFIKNLKNQNRFSVLPNGYEPTDFDQGSPLKGSHFIILHCGNLNTTQNPEVLWQSLQEILTSDPSLKDLIRIQFIGGTAPEIRQTVRNRPIEAIVEFQPFIPHTQIIKKMQQAEILLSVIPNVPDNKGIVLSKNFEYIGSGKPILIIGPPDCDIAKIMENFSNSKVCDYHDVESCKEFILQNIHNWQNGLISLTPVALREKFSRFQLTRELAVIFDRLYERYHSNKG